MHCPDVHSNIAFPRACCRSDSSYRKGGQNVYPNDWDGDKDPPIVWVQFMGLAGSEPSLSSLLRHLCLFSFLLQLHTNPPGSLSNASSTPANVFSFFLQYWMLAKSESGDFYTLTMKIELIKAYHNKVRSSTITGTAITTRTRG